MNDTSPEIEQMQHEMMMKLGPKRRLELACEMYMSARSHALRTIPPTVSDEERGRLLIDVQTSLCRLLGGFFVYFGSECPESRSHDQP